MSRAGGEGAILYAEVPGFYAAVERVADPSLRGRPVLVGGDPHKRGKVQSVSREALAAGVTPGMSMLEALARCPTARRLKTDMKRYREASGALAVCLRRVVEEIEPVGLGAAFTDAGARPEPPEVLAGRLVERVSVELDLHLRVGIAPVKFLARLAAEEAGEQGVRRVREAEVEEFLSPLPVARLPRVGPKAVATLAELGVETVGQLLALDPERLERALANHGLEILERARGRDASPVRVARHPSSMSREFSLGESRPDADDLSRHLHRLARSLETGLARQGLRARRVAVRVRDADQTVTTRSHTLRDHIWRSAEIHAAAAALLARTGVDPARARAVGLTLAGLTASGSEERQLDLFLPSP